MGKDLASAYCFFRATCYERAWTLRGIENLLIDFMINPGFVHELPTAIADYNIAQLKEAVKYDIDAVYFGDDWGQQNGLIMGYDIWKEFIFPQLKRMYQAEVREESERLLKAGAEGSYIFFTITFCRR